MMEYSPFAKALMLAEQTRRERAKKISDMLAELPDDFDWNELERLIKDDSLNSNNINN